MPENLIEVETQPHNRFIQIHRYTSKHTCLASGQNKEPTLVSSTHAINRDFPNDSVGKETTCSADDMQFQILCLEDPLDERVATT